MLKTLYRETDLKRTSRGDFCRSLGYLPDGKQPKFRLGFDKAEAQKRFAGILALWELVASRPKVFQGGEINLSKPAWDDARLKAARAIARGNTPVLSAGDHEDPINYFDRINALTQRTGISFQPDTDMYDLGAAQTRGMAEELATRLQAATGQTLHEALQAYSKHVGQEFRDAYDNLTDNGKTKQDQIKSIISYVPNWDLAKLDYKGCDEVFGIFRRRPLSKRYGKPMSRKSCSNYMGELGRFFRWLHLSADYIWKRPEDFAFIKRTPRELDEDAEREAQDVPTWKFEELKIIFEYANPLERIFILLGLNCSYGADQAGRLRVGHLHFSPEPERQSFIRRIRRKKKTRSIHVLWKVTKQAIQWAMERRPTDTNSENLLLNKNGNPYWRQTKGGNRSQDIPNLWNRLLDRIQKDHPDFRRLPFNSLRDTSANFVRRISGEEVASLHLAHKHQSKDENLGRYTNPTRRRHVKALLKLEQKFSKVFDAVVDPFPADQPKVQKQGGSNLTLRQIRQIKNLGAQGYKHAKIAEIVGVERVSVWRHLQGIEKKQKAK
jgi:hypothetical protein